MKWLLVLTLLFSCNALKELKSTNSNFDQDFYQNSSVTIITNLVWTQGNIHNSTALDLTWNNTGDPRMNTLKFNTYLTNDCTGATVQNDIALGIADVSKTVTIAGADGPRTFELIALNSSGFEIDRRCSPSMVIDTVAPTPSATVTWTESTPTNMTNINANWTLPTADVASQEITFYNDSGCGTVDSGPTAISVVQNTSSMFAGIDGTYSFKVTFYDTAGNSADSACSTDLNVDTIAPTFSQTPSWIDGIGTVIDGTAVANGTNLKLEWILSTDAVASTTIDILYYIDPACSTTATPNIPDVFGLSAVPNFFLTASPVTSSATYYSLITAIDAAGNLSTSSCSADITVNP